MNMKEGKLVISYTGFGLEVEVEVIKLNKLVMGLVAQNYQGSI